jgi:predicted O-methyltransferase YrrM
MSEKDFDAVDRFIADHLVEDDPVLQAALAESEAAGLPAINVAPNQGKLLMLLARAIGARKILEIGTLGGYSTIWLGRALTPDGRLVTLEANPIYAEVARRNIARAGLTDRIEVREGKALDTLPKLAAEGVGPFDLIFIDADKVGTPDYFLWAVRLSRRFTLIVVDNVVREGAILDAASKDASVQAMRRFFELAATDPRVSGTAIQTIGGKGHDGIAVVLVTADREA